MKINYKKGDILRANVEALVNPVNCVGVMGKGLALQFKKKFPGNFAYYKTACGDNYVQIGELLVWCVSGGKNPTCIINFPTKYHWKENSKIEYIEDGLKHLVKIINAYGIKSIAIPALGCGLGGLDWSEVKRLIEKYIGNIKGLRVIVYEPS